MERQHWFVNEFVAGTLYGIGALIAIDSLWDGEWINVAFGSAMVLFAFGLKVAAMMRDDYARSR